MANPIIKILRGATPPSATLQAGQFAVDQVAKNLYLGVEVGGVVTNEIVGGEGTFATKSYVTTAVTNATGSLGTMSTQNADAVAITGGTIDGTAIGATNASTGKFTEIETYSTSAQPNIFNNQTQFGWGIAGVGSNPLYVASTLDLSIGSGVIDLGGYSGSAVKGLGEPVNDNDAARKKYVDDKVSALGSVFHYVGDALGNDLTAFPDQTTGSYYKVIMPATYTDGTITFDAKAGDAIVKTSTGWQKLDNVDAVVSGTANEIAVTGDENAGYTVSIDPVFSGRVTTAEGDITDLETKTQNIDLAGTTSGTTQINGDIKLNGTTGATFIKATPGGRGIIVGDATDEEMFLSASGGFGVVSAIGPNLTHLTLNGSKVNIGGSFDPSVWPPTGNSTDDATEVTINAVTVKGSASGTTTLENFVIDGGVY